MKIVNLDEFRKMPEGIVFAKYEPQCFGEICIKGETVEHDFYSQSLTAWPDSMSSDEAGDILNDAEKTGQSFPLEFDSISRDGLYEKEQLFGIYEESDVGELIKVLLESLKTYQQLILK